MNPQSEPAETYRGSNSHIIVIIVLAVLLAAALGFGGWSYSKMSDYKNNSDKKAAAAVAAANKQLTAQLQAQFAEQSKSPNKTFKGSANYGSITFKYPKTWSAYVDSTDGSEPINAYFNPGEVPGVQSQSAYALRVELVNDDYSQVIQQMNSNISAGSLTAKAYLPPSLKGVTNVTPGVYYSGQINQQNDSQRGYMLVIKVRDKTLEISTQSQEYQADFDGTVLKTLSFAP